MFCKNCGQQIADNAAFCPNCGEQTGHSANAGYQQPQQPQPNQQYNQYQQNQQYNQYQQPQQNQGNAFDKFFNTADYTANYSQQEVQSGKAMSVLSYLGILVLIPLFAEKNNRYVRFHANQGFILFLLGLALWIIGIPFLFVPVAGTIIRTIFSLIQVAYIILGIVNAATDKAKELPIIGKLKLIQF
ncbi:MAG: zinc-ribbon domain-containing protein [Ruminococcus sp.]|nr:zinc-ribbon domain-containing protein [Ruminococcus sp.]